MQEFGCVDNFVLNVKTFRLIYLLETFLECTDMSESRLAPPLVASVECFFFFFLHRLLKVKVGQMCGAYMLSGTKLKEISQCAVKLS